MQPGDVTMNTYYVGWDVGALYCQDKSKSHDALCIIGEGPDSDVKVLGSYDNAIPVSKMSGSSNSNVIVFLNKMFNKQIISEGDKIIIAIDGVFRWPNALADIFNDKNIEFATENVEAINDRYLFRETERFVKEKLKWKRNPFSVIQNSIGSQSIKVMYFLQVFGFRPSEDEIGVWTDGNNIAIETYPSACNIQKGQTDLQDAYICACLAKMFDKQKKDGKLFEPPQNYDTKGLRKEGWIWFPKPESTLKLRKKDLEKVCPTQLKTN